MGTLKAGKNVWCNFGDTERVKSATRPNGEWFAVYAANRVHGDKYTPYQGQSQWELSANRAMAEEAKANFQRKSMN
jgi:hypothetical protein